MTGFEEKIEKLLEDYATDILIYNDKLDKYKQKRIVYTEQNLIEELRILQIKIDEIDLLVYSFTKMHREINESLNNWLS
jgi:hypothetical protein